MRSDFRDSIRFWCAGSHQDYIKTRSDAIKAVKRILAENQITLQQ